MLGQSISVVLPAFNEEENLPSTIADALRYLPTCFRDFEIIIVNDGSSDRTGQIARKLEADHPAIKVIHHTANAGYGAALRDGFGAAVKDLVFFTDADGQFSFSDLAAFAPLIEHRDMVLGYRKDRRDNRLRKLVARSGNALASRALGIHVRDINCAFKLFRRDLLERIPLSSNGALINTELLTYAARAGWTFEEVPVTHYPRKHGKPTGGNPWVILKTFQEYFQLRSRLRRHASISVTQD